MKMEARSRSLLVLSLLLALVAGGWAPLALEPAAVLVHREGPVEVLRAGSRARTPASVGMELSVGDQLLVGRAGRAVLLYRTGKMVETTRSHRVEKPVGPGRSGLFQQTVRTLGQVAAVDASARPNRQGMIRPIPGQPDPIQPAHGVALLRATPTFTWYHVAGAEGYVVQLRREGEPPRRFEVGLDTTWTLPDSLALLPGSAYEWTVASDADGRSGRLQRFRIATAAASAAVETRLDEMRRAGLDPAAEGAFLSAVVYRDAGFHYSADEQLRRLEATGRANGPAFHLLWAEVLTVLGRDEEARRQLELAGAAR